MAKMTHDEAHKASWLIWEDLEAAALDGMAEHVEHAKKRIMDVAERAQSEERARCAEIVQSWGGFDQQLDIIKEIQYGEKP